MAIAVYVENSSVTRAKYEAVMRDLESMGLAAPAGRLYHVAMEADDLVRVFSVWDSRESFDAFSLRLSEAASEREVNRAGAKREVSEIVNIVVGS